jgi:hypothetical protein
MNFVDCIVEGVSLIDSVQNWGSHVTIIIEVESDFEVIVAVGRNKDVFGVEVRIEDRFHEGDGQEAGIVGHMEVVVLEKFLDVDEGS